MAGEARLVQLQEQDAVADQVFHLSVHDRQQSSGDFVPIAIDVASLNAAREGVRPRNGDFGGGVGDLAESLVFLDQPQTARGGQRRDTEVPASLIVRRRPPTPGLRQRLAAGSARLSFLTRHCSRLVPPTRHRGWAASQRSARFPHFLPTIKQLGRILRSFLRSRFFFLTMANRCRSRAISAESSFFQPHFAITNARSAHN